jgi:putative endonuclease
MTRAKDAVGAYGERVAARFLVDQGMAILERNWRGTRGEIDIIAADGEVVVFCEVKTRRTESFGPPADAVVPVKVRRLRRLAAQWLSDHGMRPGKVRFDVVSVLPRPAGPAEVEHLRGAF